MQDKKLSDWLKEKPHPAYSAAQIVSEETQKRREAEYDCRQAKMLLEYYFSIFPSLQKRKNCYQNKKISLKVRQSMKTKILQDVI